MELAEEGRLEEYIRTYMPEKFRYDEKFQEDILDLVFNKSANLLPEIQLFVLEKLDESLQYFREKVVHVER